MNIGTSAKKLASLRNLRALLAEVCAAPFQFVRDVELRSALSSQGALALFQRASHEIVGSSLNTQKRICSNPDCIVDFPNGFESLNRLRLEACRALANSERKIDAKDGRSKQALEERLLHLAIQNRAIRQDCMHLTNVLVTVLRDGRQIATESKVNSLMARWGKIQAEVQIMLSLTRDRRIVKLVRSQNGS